MAHIHLVPPKQQVQHEHRTTVKLQLAQLGHRQAWPQLDNPETVIQFPVQGRNFALF